MNDEWELQIRSGWKRRELRRTDITGVCHCPYCGCSYLFMGIAYDLSQAAWPDHPEQEEPAVWVCASCYHGDHTNTKGPS